MTFPKPNALVAALVTAALLATSVPAAHAQLSERRAERERKAQAEAAAKAAAQPGREDRYPAAKREQPKLGASDKLAPKLEALYAAYDANDAAKVEALGAEIVDNDRANAYEKALAQRMMGAAYANEDEAKAIGYLQQALATGGLGNNDHFDSMFIIAQLQVQGEQYDQALATLDRLLTESGSTDPTHIALKANALYRLDRQAETIALLEPIVAADPASDPQLLQLLMGAYAETGRSAEATALGERVAAATPTDRRAQLNLAATYMQSGQDAKAAEVYEKLRAAGQLTDDRDYRNLFALYANEEGKSAQAISAINEGIDKGIVKPDHKLYAVIGQVHYFADQSDLAIEAYRKSDELAPDGESALNLAKVLAAEGRTAESKTAAQRALDKGVSRPEEARQLLSR